MQKINILVQYKTNKNIFKVVTQYLLSNLKPFQTIYYLKFQFILKVTKNLFFFKSKKMFRKFRNKIHNLLVTFIH